MDHLRMKITRCYNETWYDENLLSFIPPTCPAFSGMAAGGTHLASYLQTGSTRNFVSAFNPLFLLCPSHLDVTCCPCVPGHLSRVRLSATLWTVAHQAPLFKGILQARILEWIAMPPPGGIPDPGIRTTSLTSPAWAGRFFTTSATWEAGVYPLWRTNYWGIWLDVYIFQEITDVKDKAIFFFSCCILFKNVVPTQPCRNLKAILLYFFSKF